MAAFFILIVYLIFFLLRPHQWGLSNLADTLPITIGLLLASFGVFVLDRKTKYYPPQFWLLALVCVGILVSGLANGWYVHGINSLKTFIPTALIPLLLFANMVNSNTRQEVVMFVCITAALLMISNGVSQLNSEIGRGWAGSFISQGTRITYLGILRDPNDLGGFFVLCVPFAAYFASLGSNFFVRIYGRVSLVLLLYGIYLTNSRGALVAMLATMSSYVIYRYGVGKSFLLGALASPALAVAVSNFRDIDAQESSAAGRTEAWYAGFRMLVDNPIFGVGMGNFVEYHDLTAHNSFVLVMGELGLLGYGFWFSSVTLSMLMVYVGLIKYRTLMMESNFKIAERTELNRTYSLNNTVFFSLFGFMGTAFFLSRSYSFLMYFILALAIASYYRLCLSAPDLKFKQPGSVIAKLGALSLVSIIGMNLIIKVFK